MTAPRLAACEVVRSAPHSTVDDVASAVRARLGASHGFAVHEAEVTYWGRCPACQACQAGSPHSS